MNNIDLQKSLQEKNQYINELQEEINLLKQKEFDYEWEKRGLLNQIKKIEQNLQNALFESSISHGLISNLKSLKAEIEDLKLQIASGRSKMLRTKRKMEGLASERDSLTKENENLIVEREKLIDQIDQQGKKIDELKERQSGALAIKEELDRMEAELQSANESLAIANSKLEQSNWEIHNKEEQLNKALDSINAKDVRINEMRAEIESLKNKIESERKSDNDASSLIEHSSTNNKIEENSTYKTPKEHIKSDTLSKNTHNGTSNVEGGGNNIKNDGNDLPELKEQKQANKRSIEAVIDLDSDQYITSEEFFTKDKEDIARISRYLAESDELGKDAYVCAKCQNRVKIAKREIPGKGEVLFFTHCKKDIICDWKKERSINDGYIDYTEEDISYFLPDKDKESIARYKEVKEFIIQYLQTENSKAVGITNVQEDVVIRSNYRFMRWRRAGITANYKGRSIVFELQTKNVLMNTIVSKDIFYRLHNKHVIWIFGADEESGYGYMQRHAHQNTMFYNRRNVFFIDEDSMRESENRGELVLKCNYLDSDDKWHYRKDTTLSNGTFVTIDNLIFDDEMCKAYFFDANIPYFELHPEKEDDFRTSIHSREEIIEDLQYKFDNPTPKEPKIKNNTLVKRGKNPRHMIEKIPVDGNNKYIYGIDKVWGVISGDGERLIDIKYDEIELWTRDKYKVRKADKWGIICEGNKVLLDIAYHSIGAIQNGSSIVNTGVREFEIDEDGNELAEKTIKLKDGLIKFKMSGKWGIVNSEGEVIVDNIYDEIGSFRSRLIGFINGKAIKLSIIYDYRVPVVCNCIKKESEYYIYEVGNVHCRFLDKRELSSSEKDNFSHPGVCNIMALVNILWIDEKISLRAMSDQDWEVPFNHVDNSYDFLVGEILTATVTNIIYGKRLILKFEDGRESYMSKAMASKGGIPYSSLKVGLQITIKKVGFDDVYDRTIWEVV